jgi:hypothetical protein
MVTRFTVELNTGKTMTAVRQNRSGGADDNTLAPQSEVTVSWDLADAFDLATNAVLTTSTVQG